MSDLGRQTNNPPPALRERLAAVRERIERAARRAGRDPAAVELVAVTKTHPADAVRAAVDAGQSLFGENRLQEALPKMDAVGPGPRWHLIGHLQRNKAAAVGRFELIHSVDSTRLIEELERRAAAADTQQAILLQLNVAGEASKFGAAPADLPALLAALAAAPHLRALGLMTIPPWDDDPERTRPHFSALRRLLEEAQGPPNFEKKHLSMGMSGDFEVAIEEGATLVRLGSALFGPRL